MALNKPALTALCTAGEDDHCKVDADGGQLHGLDADPSSFFSKVYYIDQYDAEGVRQAIYHNGPISIAIDANPTAFRFYTSGVIANCSCGSKPEDLDHAILAVGYGEEAGAFETRAGKVYRKLC